MSIADRLKIARARKGFKRAVDASRAFGWTQSTYLGHENGSRLPTRDNLERYASAFGVSLDWLLTGQEVERAVMGQPAKVLPFQPLPGAAVPSYANDDELPQNAIDPRPYSAGNRDFPVYAAAEGGPGEIVVNTDPLDMIERPGNMTYVKDGFGVLVVGESMTPAFEPGDIAFVNPKLPVQPSRNIILVGDEELGEFRASIKFLIKSEPTRWYVRQYNPPKDFWVEKRDWPRILRVVGKYSAL